MPPAIQRQKHYKLVAFENLEECVDFMHSECDLHGQESVDFFKRQWEDWSSCQKIELIDSAYELIRESNEKLSPYIDVILKWVDSNCTVDTWSNLLIEQEIERIKSSTKPVPLEKFLERLDSTENHSRA